MCKFVLNVLLICGLFCEICQTTSDRICGDKNWPKINFVTIDGSIRALSDTAIFEGEVAKLNSSFSQVMVPEGLDYSLLIELISTNNNINSLEEIFSNQTFPALKTLNLAENLIRNLNISALSQLKDLVNLDLSYNCLEAVDFEALLHNNKGLLTVNLRGNFLKELMFSPSQNFNFPSDGLRFLDLSFNELQSFHWRGLIIRKLLVNNNEIEEMFFNEPHQMVETVVEVQFNKIREYRSNVVYKSLNLSHNLLQQMKNVDLLHGGKFQHSLDLSFNEINFVKEIISKKDQDLLAILGTPVFLGDEVHLNLSYNRIDNLKFTSEKIRDAVYLNLEGNRLRDFDDMDIKDLFPSLKTLNLRNNQFDELFVQEIQKNEPPNITLEINFVPIVPEVKTENSTYYEVTSEIPRLITSEFNYLLIIIPIVILVLSIAGLSLYYSKNYFKRNDDNHVVKMTV